MDTRGNIVSYIIYFININIGGLIMSKKFLISAVTTALVVGAASTTFAAANPFSDVPADSWAYDAVTTLVNDGVVDGYPDGTYKGQNTMTRYEMAQIVARAMAKTDVNKADKALVDKLAAEFAEELDNLGVRVADLEKKSDNVKWGGKVRYRYTSTDNDNTAKHADKQTHSIKLRLEPKAYIGNSGWTANARIDYEMDLNSDSNASDTTVDRAWVQGPLFGGTVKAGKVPLFTEQGMIIDDPFSGVVYTGGSDVFKTTLAAGRYSETGHADNGSPDRDITAEYYSAQFDYTPNDKLALDAGYIQLSGIDANRKNFSTVGDDSLGIWYAGGSYAFDKNVKLVGQYAQSDADDFEKAGDVEIQYKAVDKSDPGSWSAYAGYRHLGQNAVIKPTYNVADPNQKGYVFGINYVPFENAIATLEYFDGKYMSDDSDASKFFGQIDFFF